MSRPSNQAIERHYFEQFRVHYPIPVGAVTYGDKPDVIIRGEQLVGVEIANLYLTDGSDPGGEQTQRRFRKEILEQGQSLYLAGGGRAIELTVAFDPGRPIRDKKAVAVALANAAKSIDKLPAGPVQKSYFAQIPELSFIYHNPKEYLDAAWRASQVYAVPSLALDRLGDILDEKHRKLAGYSRCDAYWLLLVVDFADFAQDQDIAWPVSAAPIASKFAKIIIYKPQFAEWVEVPIRNDG